MAIDITSWGISIGNNASTNTDKWNQNIQSGQEVYLPADPGGNPYMFNKINIVGIDNVTFYGDPDSNGNLPVIKFGDDRNLLKIENADSFNIHDLIFDGRLANNEGGVWAKDGATNGILKI